MEQKCIYCGKNHDLSESDIIPDALTNARIFNNNVCRIEHNNRFSDMFESKVIEALAFITNELDIKSSKGKNYASYDAVITIEGTDYNLKLHGDNEIFNGRVIKSSDNTQMISSYDKAVKIAKDESKVHPLDVNTIELEKKVKINNAIFFDTAMYRERAEEDEAGFGFGRRSLRACRRTGGSAGRGAGDGAGAECKTRQKAAGHRQWPLQSGQHRHRARAVFHLGPGRAQASAGCRQRGRPAGLV